MVTKLLFVCFLLFLAIHSPRGSEDWPAPNSIGSHYLALNSWTSWNWEVAFSFITQRLSGFPSGLLIHIIWHQPRSNPIPKLQAMALHWYQERTTGRGEWICYLLGRIWGKIKQFTTEAEQALQKPILSTPEVVAQVICNIRQKR